MAQIKSAYDILNNPEKRAEYDQSRAHVNHETENSPNRTCDPGQNPPVDEQFPAARGQLQLQRSKRSRARQTPPRTQLRAQAQLRAHAHRLARLQRQVQAQGLREVVRQVEVRSDEESENIWDLLSQVFEAAETAYQYKKRKEEEKEALAQKAAEQEAKLREEEAAREEAAAAQAWAKEIEWINKEAEDSILVLAGMGERPMAPMTTGYAKMLHEDHVRRLVEKTDDLLDYLWDKAHSGDWICPEIKGGIDLDRLLGLVLNHEAEQSYFPSATKDQAASLLRKWRGEECDETDDSSSPPCSDSESSEGGSATGESEAEGESPSADLKCEYRTKVSGEACTANSTSSSQSTHKQLSRATQLLHRMRTSRHLLRRVPTSHRHLHKMRSRSPRLPLATSSTILAPVCLSLDGSVCDHRLRTKNNRIRDQRSRSMSVMFELLVVVSLRV